LCEMKDRCLPS